ncbi:uroporphyrinogen-III synthase [Aquisalimonas asiatica]|uniref:Uroporphyrinogen-III synthase n=1 Tax=Aquisalimonas asiatica TaxID=406100 RepID=A0A1H8UDL3_9GAMM|nr:uroporphyrinogen-III synthase [Aquisalimonas asiatica]SEP01319.1 uroporphyrinogen-III synthase [Aquisalimonas asiatica]
MTAAEQPLAGVGVLVTRPAHQAEPLCDALAARGAVVTRFPVIAIGAAPDPRALDRGLDRLGDADLVIFVSPNAVDALFRRLNERRLSWPDGVRVATVGRGTARALAARDVTATVVPADGYDSEALLAHPALRHVRGQHAMLVRGDGGRELLRETLERRGATVDVLAAYSRGLPDVDPAVLDQAWARGALDVAVVTSGNALENLVRLAGAPRRSRLFGTGLVVISERVAARASGLGFCNGIVTADGPDSDALAAAVERWVAGKGRQANS